MLYSLQIGVAHAVGAISVGANAITSLTHEIIRNLSIGLFNFGLKNVSGQFNQTTQGLQNVGQAAQQAGQKTQTVAQYLNQAGQAGSGFSGVLATVNTRLLLNSTILGVVGIVLDKLADKILAVGLALSKASGEFSLAFTQLEAVIKSNETQTGRSLGTMEEWRESLIGISQISGKSIADLSQLSAAFLGIDKSAAISSKGILELTESAAILAPQFRNQIELLTNYRGALLGNFRAINGNIFVANNQSDANQRYIDILIRQGKTQEEATKISEKTAQIERNRVVIIEAGITRVNSLKDSTTLLNVATSRLEGSTKSLLATMGRGAEIIQAGFFNFLNTIVKGFSELPDILLRSVGVLTIVGGSILNVTAKVLKLVAVVGLLSAAVAFLNANLLVTIPLLGTSLSVLLGSLAIKLGATVSQVSQLPLTLGKAVGAIVSALTTKFLPAIVTFLTRFTIIGTAVTAVVLGFNRLSQELGGVADTFSALSSPLTTIVGLFDGLVPKLELATRAAAALRIVVNGLALVIGLATDRTIRLALGILTLRRLAGDTEELKAKSKELEDQLKKSEKAYNKITAEIAKFTTTITSSSAALRAHKGALEGVFSAQSALKGDLGLTEEQQKAFDRAAISLKDQVTQLRARNIELTKGKGAATEFKLAARIEKAIEAIKEADKEAGELTDTQIAGIKKKLEAEEREGIILGDNNELLEHQNRIFDDIVNAVKSVTDSFNKQIQGIQANTDAELVYREVLRSSNKDFEDRIKSAEFQKKLIIETAKVENEIVELRKKLTDPITKDGRQFLPKDILTKEQIAGFENQIKKLEQQKINLPIALAIEDSTKEFNAFLEDTQKQVDSLGKKLTEELNISEQQLSVSRQYNKDLEIGVDFAEQQRSIRQKELDIEREIEQIRIRLASGKLGQGDITAAQARLAELENTKNQIVANATTALIQERADKVKQSIIEINNSLKEQLALIKERATLFSEGVLRGEFSQVQETLDALTSSLQSLIAERIKLQRLQEQNLFVDPAEITKVTSTIDALKESLKALNVIKTIQDVFTGVTDAIQFALTEGVKGVAQGTQTIKELFRKMASDILLSIAKISADFVIEDLKKKFFAFALDIAKSDLGKKIGAAFGIDFSKLDFKSPQEKAQSALENNTTAQEQNTLALDRLTAKLSGTTETQGNPVLPPNTIQTTDITGQVGKLIDFEQVARDITDGTAIVEVASSQEISGLFEKMTEYIQFGIEQVNQTSETGFTGLFQGIGRLITDLAQSLVKAFSSDSGGGKGASGAGGIFSSALGIITKFFSAGAGKGRIIPGTPSDKDNQIIPVASGEAITNARAVQYYGEDFMNAINNMSLPHDVFSTMQQNSASTALAGMKPAMVPVRTAVPGGNVSQPIQVTVINSAPQLDPKALGLQEKDIIRVVVNGVDKDTIIRKTIINNVRTSGVGR